MHYPTVKSHRDYEVANRPGMFHGGFGGVLSFEIKGDGNPWSQDTFDATARFIDALKIPYIGPSLGGVESLVEQVNSLLRSLLTCFLASTPHPVCSRS